MRTRSLVLVLAAGAVTVAVPSVAHAAPARSCVDHGGTSAGVSGFSQQDIDDSGYPDLVTGVPDASSAGKAKAGIVDVHYDVFRPTGSGRAPQRVGESYFAGIPAAAGDRFGASSSFLQIDPPTGEEDFDYCEEVAVGAPGADGGRGAVVIARGSVDGLSSTGAIRITGRSAGEHFGAALVADGNDLWVAAPDRTVDGQKQAGAVDHYTVDGTGHATLVETIRQGSAGIAGTPETGDHFGSALAHASGERLAVGTPDEDIGRVKDAGMATMITYNYTTNRVGTSYTVHQNSPGVGGAAEAGDRFGAAVSLCWDSEPQCGLRMAVGVPGEDVGSVRDAGMVQIFDRPPGLAVRYLGAITQNSPSVSGSAEAGDQFGASVVLGSFTHFSGEGHDFAVAIGAPGEDLGSAADAGDVVTVEMTAQDSSHITFIQREPAIARGAASAATRLSGAPTAGDRLGASLSAVAMPDLISDTATSSGGALLTIAAPGWDVGGATDAGTITLFRDGPAPLAGPAQVRTTLTDSAGPVAGEHYGVAATTTPNGVTL